MTPSHECSPTSPPPQDAELRFFCDQTLLGLGRWLRAAGYDTEVATGVGADGQLAALARGQQRLLLTQDRALAVGAGGDSAVMLLSGNDLAAWARELAVVLGLDWLYRPFSRCLCCNSPLAAATAERCAQLPPALRAAPDVRYCAACDKLYWEGSHMHRMRQRLREWCTRYAQVRAGLADTLQAGVVLDGLGRDGTGLPQDEVPALARGKAKR